MSSDKEIKFYTVVYLSFYDFIKNDKKKTTTFMNQSKKLFPGENIEKIIAGKSNFSKSDDALKNGLENLLEWLENGIRSFSQEQKVKELGARLRSYTVNKKASEDLPKDDKKITNKPKEPKESKEPKVKVDVKVSEPTEKLSNSKLLYELYQFVSKDKKRSKAFTNRISGLDLSGDIIDTIIDNLVDVDELEKYNNEITSELIQEILLFIKGGLRSKVQSEKFENLEKCFDTSTSSKDVSKKEKTEKSKPEVKSKTQVKKTATKNVDKKSTKVQIYKFPVRKINYNKIIAKNKFGKITISDFETIHKPVNTLRLKLDEKALTEKFLTQEIINDLQVNVIQNESEIFEQYPITISVEEIESLMKFVCDFKKFNSFNEKLKELELSDYENELLEKNNAFQTMITTRHIWLEMIRCLITEVFSKRERELIGLFILPNFFEYMQVIAKIEPKNTKVTSTKSKTNQISWYMSTKYISVTLDNTIKNIYFGDPKFMDFKNLIQDIEDTKINDKEFIERAKLLLKTESVVQQEMVEEIKDFLNIHKNIKIIDNSVIINNITFSGSQAKDLISLIKLKNISGINALTNFLKNLSLNPSRIAQKELYNFCLSNGLPITPMGTVLLYKWVENNYLDKHSRTMLNKPGVIVWQKRDTCDLDSNNSCSTGLHLASFGYGKFASKLLVAEMNPANCIAVPDKYQNNKLRCTAYKILLEASDFYDENTTQSKDFLVNIFGHHNPNILERQILRYFGNNFKRKFSTDPKSINCAEDVDIFHKNLMDYDKSKILVSKNISSPLVGISNFKIEIKITKEESSKKSDKLGEIRKFISDPSYNKINFNYDDFDCFIKNEPNDLISLYELILDKAVENSAKDDFKSIFLSQPNMFTFKLTDKDFINFVSSWKKLLIDFISLAQISEEDYMLESDHKGSSIVEVSSYIEEEVKDLSMIKKLWNTMC